MLSAVYSTPRGSGTQVPLATGGRFEGSTLQRLLVVGLLVQSVVGEGCARTFANEIKAVVEEGKGWGIVTPGQREKALQRMWSMGTPTAVECLLGRTGMAPTTADAFLAISEKDALCDRRLPSGREDIYCVVLSRMRRELARREGVKG